MHPFATEFSTFVHLLASSKFERQNFQKAAPSYLTEPHADHYCRIQQKKSFMIEDAFNNKIQGLELSLNNNYCPYCLFLISLYFCFRLFIVYLCMHVFFSFDATIFVNKDVYIKYKFIIIIL